MNHASTTLFGWSMAERKGKRIDLFISQKNWSETNEMIQKYIIDILFYNVETRRYTKN
jgi:hypothetical protein